MTTVLGDIVEILMSALAEVGEGIATALTSTMKAFFIETTGEVQALSTAGGIIIVFVALSLALSLSYLAINYIFSMGNNR